MAPLATTRAKPASNGPVGDTATRILDATLATMADHGIVRLSLEDVARITHRKVGAVKALQHRALQQLNAALGA